MPVQYSNQMHVCYRSAADPQYQDRGDLIWDVWYDGHRWQPQLLTGAARGTGNLGVQVGRNSQNPGGGGSPCPS